MAWWICGSLAGVEMDQLGVAAELEVGDAVAAPAVLIVSQQQPVGVGGERGLAGPGKPQEKGEVAVPALVGRGVQRQDPGLGQQVVHDGEHQLLDAAPVGGADDDADAVDVIHGHDHVRDRAVGKFAQLAEIAQLVQLVGGQGHENEGLVAVDAAADVPGRGTEHGDGEEGREGLVADGAHRQGVAAVGAHDAVGDVQPVLSSGQLQGVLEDHGERVGSQRQVVGRIPVDLGLDLGPADDQRVLGAAAGRLDARPGGQRAVGADQGFPVLHHRLDQVAAPGIDQDTLLFGDQAIKVFYEFHGSLLLLKRKL